MKTIFVHAGLGKTATTHIQMLLYESKDILEMFDYLYPVNEYFCKDRKDHYEFAIMVNSLNKERRIKETRNFIQKIGFAEQNNIIIDSEFLFNKNAFLFFKNISKSAKIIFVIYMRRQDKWLESEYQQAIKMRDQAKGKGIYKGTTHTLKEWISNRNANYFEALEFLKTFIAQENIIVRPFEQQQLYKNSVFLDFLNTLGIKDINKFKQIEQSFRNRNKIINKSLSRNSVSILRIINGMDFNHNEWKNIYKMIINNDYIFDHKQDLLSSLDKIEILKKYETSNSKVAKKYLKRKNGNLFYEPWPKPDNSVNIDNEELSREEIIEFFVRIIKNITDK